jgi:flavodoxin
MKSLLVLYSYHHNNTRKIANAFAKVLDAEIRAPQQIDPDELQTYGLVGFGSGIYSDKHHRSLFDLVEKLPRVDNGEAFIFSTSGAPAFAFDEGHLEDYAEQAHSPLREKLQSKGYTIVGEFICPGHNTNRFLRAFGGINKGRPNAEDLRRAEEFAQKLKRNVSDSKVCEKK